MEYERFKKIWEDSVGRVSVAKPRFYDESSPDLLDALIDAAGGNYVKWDKVEQRLNKLDKDK